MCGGALNSLNPFRSPSAPAPVIVRQPDPVQPVERAPLTAPVEDAPAPVIKPKSARDEAQSRRRGKRSLRIERSGLSNVGSGVNVPS